MLSRIDKCTLSGAHYLHQVGLDKAIGIQECFNFTVYGIDN